MYALNFILKRLRKKSLDLFVFFCITFTIVLFWHQKTSNLGLLFMSKCINMYDEKTHKQHRCKMEYDLFTNNNNRH